METPKRALIAPSVSPRDDVAGPGARAVGGSGAIGARAYAKRGDAVVRARSRCRRGGGVTGAVMRAWRREGTLRPVGGIRSARAIGLGPAVAAIPDGQHLTGAEAIGIRDAVETHQRAEADVETDCDGGERIVGLYHVGPGMRAAGPGRVQGGCEAGQGESGSETQARERGHTGSFRLFCSGVFRGTESAA